MIDMNTPALSRLREKEQELRTARIEYQKELQASLSGIFREFFEKHPAVSAIVWKQYTPYFNDGEPCEFSVGEPELFFEGMDYGYQYADGYGTWTLNRPALDFVDDAHKALVTGELKNDFGAIADALLADEDTTQAIFGDHVRVVATKEGFDVQDYDHD